MNRTDLDELHCIIPLTNVPSVVTHGLLSHVRAQALPGGPPKSVAAAHIQAIRSGVRVPQGRPLHEYANLYLYARNAMMSLILFKKWATAQELSVLRFHTDVLDIPLTVIADGNAASNYTSFRASPGGLAYINKGRCFADSWKHPTDQIDEWRHKREMCAEVLVPDVVPPEHLLGAWVVDAASKAALDSMGTGLPTALRPALFFK